MIVPVGGNSSRSGPRTPSHPRRPRSIDLDKPRGMSGGSGRVRDRVGGGPTTTPKGEVMGPTGTGKWCVYRMTLHGNATGGNVVCEQSEWEAIDRARPGYHTLLHSGI